MTPGFFLSSGEYDITETGKSREKQHWKGFGMKLFILNVLTVNFLLHIKIEMLRKQNGKQI